MNLCLMSSRRQQALILEMAEPFAEHVFGIQAFMKACLARLNGADDRRTGRPGGPVGETKIGKLE
jgi:hypothetical protein